MLIFGSAWGIRTPDLRLERAVSWAARRMRHLMHQPPARICRLDSKILSGLIGLVKLYSNGALRKPRSQAAQIAGRLELFQFLNISSDGLNIRVRQSAPKIRGHNTGWKALNYLGVRFRY